MPCLTLRENTERPVTLDVGTNRLAGTGTESILTAFRSTFSKRIAGEVPPFWDGQAAGRIVTILVEKLPRIRAARSHCPTVSLSPGG